MAAQKNDARRLMRFEDRFPQDTPLTGEAARARAAQAEHALKRLEILKEEGYENIVHRTPQKLAELRKRHLASRKRQRTLKT